MGSRPPLHCVRFAAGLVLALAPVVGLALAPSPKGWTDADRPYAQAAPDNTITRLQRRIDSGQVALAYDDKRGYLPAVLKALQIPVSSQMLVFSRTSVQKDLISPQTPRALYFNEDTYIGYLPGAKSLEVAVTDPQLGPVYYVLLQRPSQRPLFFRTVDACLECHAGKTDPVPVHLMRSVYADENGLVDPKTPGYMTTDASPMNERWGGWYVTGTHGGQRHMGNVFATRQDGKVTLDREKGANLTDLHTLVDTAPYLTPHSDIVALMVMAHQTHLQNLILQANYRTRKALAEEKAANSAIAPPAEHRVGTSPGPIAEACEPLVKALLFVGVAPLTAPITGTSGFTEQFVAGGPRDHRHRSLREFDLKRRLFRYPCSYTIYSEAFDALPAAAKAYVFRRLREVLRGHDQGQQFAHLSTADRKAILEILRETKPDCAAAWKTRRSHRLLPRTVHGSVQHEREAL